MERYIDGKTYWDEGGVVYRELEYEETVTSDCQCQFHAQLDDDYFDTYGPWTPLMDGMAGKTVAENDFMYFNFRAPVFPTPAS